MSSTKNLSDISEDDATDWAHPAWWRGYNYAVDSICEKVKEILDGKEISSGTCLEPWESTRRRLFELRKKANGS